MYDAGVPPSIGTWITYGPLAGGRRVALTLRRSDARRSVPVAFIIAKMFEFTFLKRFSIKISYKLGNYLLELISLAKNANARPCISHVAVLRRQQKNVVMVIILVNR